ncbi:4838_t:CDS:1 [Cetraspora pellucida]|uniref:4838_t:CDS:1 n=1 Tax=Cetraspora pellucida TaxID=1433469 RepID=A0ACA9K8P6_9GLOM|nr:4838_t:CDS:1 [Cetraspora pellucida]
MESEINFLRQKNARLMAKITGLEVENADVKSKHNEATNKIMKLRAELKSRIDELEKNRTDTVAENAELRDRVMKLEQDIDALKKELESKKNRKFQEKCILIAQILLNEEPVIEYRPSFMEGLELDPFFRHNRIALEVQGAQHQFHSTSWYKDVKKLEDIVDRDRKKRTLCQLNGIYLLEVWYDENPEITIPKKIYKFREFIDRKTFNLD